MRVGAKSPEGMQRAYSTFVVKMVDEDEDEDKRHITGIATTPAPDRVGDIVEPKGAEFKLPIPLLWQHNSREPIGHVTSAKVTKDGIEVKAEFVKIKEAGKLKDRLDEAWQSIKSGLVRGLSIGFRAKEYSFIEESDGIRFMKWDWLELSAVTIPANVEATILAVKAADQPFQGAASGTVTKVVSINPGATGSTSRKTQMKTFKEQITAYEATRAAKAAELQAMLTKSEGETLDASGQEQFDGLEAEIKAIDGHLARLRVAEKLNAEKATAVEDVTKPEKVGTVPATVRAKSNLEPGIRFARMAMSIARAKSAGVGMTPEQYYRAEGRWMDTAPEVALALKTAVNAGDSTTAGWASEWAYAQNIATEFIEFLRPATIVGRITGWRNVPFNIRVGGQSAGSTGYWVGQGKGIPVSKPTSTSVSLGIAKVAGLVSIDKELARLSSPSAELMVRDDLAKECQKVLDLSLIDPNQGGQTNIQPASLLYGVTPVTPSGTNYAAFVTDVKSLMTTAIAAQLDISQAVWVTSPTTALALSLMVTSLGNPQFPGLSMTGGTLMGLPVVVSTQATIAGSPQYSNMLVLIFPGEVFMADDGQATVESSDQVSIQMDDATTQSSTATSTGTTVVSMFQTESIAIKAVRYINWAKARSSAAAFIQAAAYA